MKLVIGLMCLLLVGCATNPQYTPIQDKCNNVGNYARTMATLKDMGVKEQDLYQFTGYPVALTYPMQGVQREIYSMDTKNPAEAYAYIYKMCKEQGYNNLLESLKKKETEREAVEDKKFWDLHPEWKQSPLALRMDNTLEQKQK